MHNESNDGNTTQAYNVRTASLLDESQLDAFLNSNTRQWDEFRIYIEDLIARKGISKAQLAFTVENTMTQAHLYSIINGNRKPLNRVHMIAIGIALKLSIDEFNELLKNSGHKPLDSRRNVGDACVIYGITKGCDYEQINELLNKHKAEYCLYKI